MNIETITTHIGVLERQLDRVDSHTASNGRNKAIRDKALRDMEGALITLKGYIQRNDDLNEALFEFVNRNQFGYAEVWEFKYFERDLNRFVRHLKDKLKELQENKHTDEAE